MKPEITGSTAQLQPVYSLPKPSVNDDLVKKKKKRSAWTSPAFLGQNLLKAYS